MNHRQPAPIPQRLKRLRPVLVATLLAAFSGFCISAFANTTTSNGKNYSDAIQTVNAK